MAYNNNMIEVTLKVKTETEKAIQVEINDKGQTRWLPKSQLKGEFEVDKICKFEMAEWLVKAKDM